MLRYWKCDIDKIRNELSQEFPSFDFIYDIYQPRYKDFTYDKFCLIKIPFFMYVLESLKNNFDNEKYPIHLALINDKIDSIINRDFFAESRIRYNELYPEIPYGNFTAEYYAVECSGYSILSFGRLLPFDYVNFSINAACKSFALFVDNDFRSKEHKDAYCKKKKEFSHEALRLFDKFIDDFGLSDDYPRSPYKTGFKYFND